MQNAGRTSAVALHNPAIHALREQKQHVTIARLEEHVCAEERSRKLDDDI